MEHYDLGQVLKSHDGKGFQKKCTKVWFSFFQNYIAKKKMLSRGYKTKITAATQHLKAAVTDCLNLKELQDTLV